MRERTPSGLERWRSASFAQKSARRREQSNTVVISADNSLPHLLTDDDLARALASVRGCLAPGGVFLASVRDYDTLVRDRVAGVLPTRHERDGEQWIHGCPPR